MYVVLYLLCSNLSSSRRPSRLSMSVIIPFMFFCLVLWVICEEVGIRVRLG